MIKHKAFVKEVTDSSLTVTILNQSACASCHVNGACSMADVQEKEVEIGCFNGNYKPGQEVSVVFKESLGIKALVYGYVLPFFLVLFSLIILYALTNNEVTSGLLAMAMLIPYYFILYFFRGVFKKIFKFELEETIQL